MLSFLNENFYHQLSRRELRDLLWATESSATSPNAVLIVVVEEPGKSISKKTFVAPTTGDLAGFCDEVVRDVKMMAVVPNEPTVENDALKKELPQEESPQMIHLIYSDHPHCLWKLSLDVIERSLRSRDNRVVQHRFSAVWQKRVEVLHS